MNVDFERSLKTAMQTGTVVTGANETLEAIEAGEAKLAIVAVNAPEKAKKKILSGEAPVFEYPGTSVQLGPAIGVPYIVSALAIIDPGKSDILALSRGVEVE